MPLDRDPQILLQRKQNLGSKWSSMGLPYVGLDSLVLLLSSSYREIPLKSSIYNVNEQKQWPGPSVFGRWKSKHQLILFSLWLINVRLRETGGEKLLWRQSNVAPLSLPFSRINKPKFSQMFLSSWNMSCGPDPWVWWWCSGWLNPVSSLH